MTEDSTTTNGIGRRNYLALTAVAASGLAGCSSGSEDGTANSTPAGATPKAFTRQFYETLFLDNDIEGANALYHEESPAPTITPDDFSEWGGIEAMQASVESVDVVAESGDTATVHAEIIYRVPAGAGQDMDYLYLRKSGEQWRMEYWLAESPRERLARVKAREFYETLYGEADIEAANAMFHPDSSSGEVSASDFEQYGGLDAMEATVEETELVSEGDGEAEVHVEVAYTTSAGSSTATDHVFLELDGYEWKIDRWVPEATRE